MITLERAKELLDYDPETGILTWRVSRGCRRAGALAGSIGAKGYLRIGLDGNDYYAHQIGWLLHYGTWPDDQIDHRNRHEADNSIENLREATTSQNVAYAPKKSSSSGYRGVYWKKAAGKWCAKIRVRGKMIHIGYFDDAAIAHEAYKSAAIEHFGEFAAF